MLRNDMLARTVKAIAITVVAIAVGTAITVFAAWLAHQSLVIAVGEPGIPAIDDTPLMFALVAGSYLAGGLSGLAVFAVGWLRFIGRRP